MARDPNALPPSSDATGGADDDELQREQDALERKPEGLIGDTAENRNLTGSSTWETLPEPEGERRRATNHTETDRSSGSSSMP